MNTRLFQLNYEELIRDNRCNRDCANLGLHIHDYERVTYRISTLFNTTTQEKLWVDLIDSGISVSHMEVEQEWYDSITQICYEFSSAIFAKYFKDYATNHVEARTTLLLFDRQEFLLIFFNVVIENGRLMQSWE